MAGSPLTAVLHQVRKLAGLPLMVRPTDPELLERFTCSGDSAAFEALVARHGPLVWRVCRRVLGHDHDAEDAWQATFLVLARRAGTIRNPASVASWLHGVAFRLAEKARAAAERRRARERSTPPPQPLPPRVGEGQGRGATPCHEAAWREMGRLIEEAVHALPERYRIPILLCYWEGRTNVEAARRLGWATGTLKARLAKARQLLHEGLSARGVTLPVGAAALLLAPGGETARALPPSLGAATASALLAGARGEVGSVSAGAVALTREALPRAGLSWLKRALVVLLVLGAVGLGAGGLARTRHDKPAARPQQGATAAERPQEPDAAQASPRKDRYGDPLPPGAIARLGTTRFRHAGWGQTAVVCSPDGRWLACHEGSVVCLLDAVTGKRVREYRGHKGRILCLAYSPDGKAIASGGDDHTFRVWDVATGRELSRFQGEPAKRSHGFSAFAQVLFTPDSKALVTRGEDNLVRLWDIATGREVRRFTEYQDLVWTIALARDGKTLAALVTPPGSDNEKMPNEVYVWEVATGKQIRRWPVPADLSIRAFAPDLDVLVTRPRGRPPYELTVWDMATGKPLRTLEDARGATYSADGKTVVTYGRSICFWDLATGKERRRVKHPWPGSFTHWILLPDGKTLLSWWRRVIVFHDIDTGKELRSVDGHASGVRVVAFLPDGQSVVSAAGEEVRVWDVAGQKVVRRFGVATNRGSDFITGLALSPGGKTILVGTANHGLQVWDVAGGPQPRQPPVGSSDHLVLSPDGKALVTTENRGPVILWDPRSWKLLRKWDPGEKWIPSVAFSQDSKVLTVSALGEGQIVLMRWDVATGRELPGFGKQARVATTIAYSPDGRLLAAVEGFQTIRLWEAGTGALRAVTPMTDNVHSIAFSPDSRFLATANRGGFRRASKDGNDGNNEVDRIRLVDTGTGQVVHRFADHRGGVAALAFSPDGKLLASGGNDTTVLVWDMTAVRVPRPTGPPRPAELEALWADLAGADGIKAHRAVWALATAPERSVPFLKERLPPATAADARQVARLLADLDSTSFSARARANRELEQLADLAGPALRQALAEPGSLEQRRRVESLLAKLDGPVQLPEGRRALRAVEALEHAGTREARTLLEGLAAGAPQARLTREAQTALERLRKRAPASP
ncbi:MAG: sigma-70 family RNA polymerase sigma factor [Gemmataceae bacterium]|nr:sigma-70 family RNA polymerase sigma factor [Gemmataceae bacterium]